MWTRLTRHFRPLAAMTALLVTIGLAAPTCPVRAQEPSPERPVAAPLPDAPPVVLAQDGSCASVCQTQHDQCRVATKGSPSCDTARQRCLQACIASKKKDR